MSNLTATHMFELNELWIDAYVRAGLAELERYLASQAAFADFLRRRPERDPRS